MINRIKIAGPYLLILFLVVLLIGFNSWTGKVKAEDTSNTTVTVGNAAPVVSSVSLAIGDDINLTENATTGVTVRALVTDDNGCPDVRDGLVKGYIYQATQTASCSADLDDCYLVASCSTAPTYNDCTGNSDTSYIVSCTANLQYFAVPTDATSSDSADEWYGAVMAQDSAGADDITSSSTQTVDVVLLRALEASSSIPYSAVPANTDTGASPIQMGIENTGNSGMNPLVSATTTLTKGGDTIADANQQYASVSTTYDDTYNATLSGTAVSLELNLPKPTDTTYPVDDTIFWGLGVDVGQPAGDYSGVNTFTATGD